MKTTQGFKGRFGSQSEFISQIGKFFPQTLHHCKHHLSYCMWSCSNHDWCKALNLQKSMNNHKFTVLVWITWHTPWIFGHEQGYNKSGTRINPQIDSAVNFQCWTWANENASCEKPSSPDARNSSTAPYYIRAPERFWRQLVVLYVDYIRGK